MNDRRSSWLGLVLQYRKTVDCPLRKERLALSWIALNRAQ